MSKPLAALLLLALLAGGCSASTPTTGPPPSGTPSDGPSRDSEPPDYVIDWGPDAEPVDLPGGWRVRDCEGDAPLLCVEHGGEVVGTLERNDFPAPEELVAPDSDEGRLAALRRFADERATEVAEDRAKGCGQEYVVDPLPVAQTTIGDAPAVRYGFRGSEDGMMTELVVNYATVIDQTLWIIVADAASKDGCMAAPELDLFAPDVLEDFLPTLDDMISATVLR